MPTMIATSCGDCPSCSQSVRPAEDRANFRRSITAGCDVGSAQSDQQFQFTSISSGGFPQRIEQRQPLVKMADGFDLRRSFP